MCVRLYGSGCGWLTDVVGCRICVNVRECVSGCNNNNCRLLYLKYKKLAPSEPLRLTLLNYFSFLSIYFAHDCRSRRVVIGNEFLSGCRV